MKWFLAKIQQQETPGSQRSFLLSRTQPLRDKRWHRHRLGSSLPGLSRRGSGTSHPPACGAVPHLRAAVGIRGHRSAWGRVENAPLLKSHSLDRRSPGLGRPPAGPPGLQAHLQAWGGTLGAHSENSRRWWSQLYPNPSAAKSDFYGLRIIISLICQICSFWPFHSLATFSI